MNTVIDLTIKDWHESIDWLNMIHIWPFDKAPPVLRNLSINGGDEDWVAAIPPGMGNPYWIESLGVCSVDYFESADGWVIAIGSHA